MTRLCRRGHVMFGEKMRHGRSEAYCLTCNRISAAYYRAQRIASGVRLCECGCGAKVYKRFVTGHRKSRLAHGHSVINKRTPEYRAYESAKRRCNNPREKAFVYYGARGVRFLFNSFPEFYKEVGPKPVGGYYSLDRIDTNGNYEAGNVRWATPAQQLASRRITQSAASNARWAKYRARIGGIQVEGRATEL
jgi:hypothetical protein